MKLIRSFAVSAVLVVVSGVGVTASAQDAVPAPSAARIQPQTDASSAWHAYRADFSLNEIESGKKVNSRQYSLDLNAGDMNHLVVGTKVPISVKSGEVSYQDIGTKISARVREKGDNLIIDVQCNVSDLATQPTGSDPADPVVRQFSMDTSTIVSPGKSTVLGVADDTTSKRQFQLEVTVTELK